MVGILEVRGLCARREIGVGRGELETNDAGERQLLPGATRHDEVILQGQVSLAADEVVGELTACAWKLQDPLVLLDDVEIRAGHPRREAEEACLFEDVFGARAF